MTETISHVVEFEIKSGGYSGPGKLGYGRPSKPEDLGTLQIHLYGYVVPGTVKNFCQIANGVTVNTGYGIPKEISYKNSKFHRVIKNFMIQGGDVVSGNGRGSFSIYGGKFRDESFALTHNRGGLLSMANSGPDTNGSQFFITARATPWLDGKHVVFGTITKSGMDILRKIENAPKVSWGDEPNPEIWIAESRCSYVAE